MTSFRTTGLDALSDRFKKRFGFLKYWIEDCGVHILHSTIPAYGQAGAFGMDQKIALLDRFVSLLLDFRI
jgi:hypothetical protein